MATRTKVIFTLAIILLALIILSCSGSTLFMTNVEIMEFVQGTPIP
jgi:hypothetical protein